MTKSPEIEHPQKAFGWAARDPSGVLSPFRFSRRCDFIVPHPFALFLFIMENVFEAKPISSASFFSSIISTSSCHVMKSVYCKFFLIFGHIECLTNMRKYDRCFLMRRELREISRSELNRLLFVCSFSQGNGRQRCEVQSAVLWDLPH